MANKDFVVRNGLIVGNTFAVNASSNTVSVIGTVHAVTIMVSGSAIPDGTTANLAFDRANNTVNANTGGTITGDVTITKNLFVGNVYAKQYPMFVEKFRQVDQNLREVSFQHNQKQTYEHVYVLSHAEKQSS